MLASTLILTVLAGKALAEAAPAPEYTYPETITIHPPKTRKIWPINWRFKPNHTDNLLTFAARETSGAGVSALPFESDELDAIFLIDGSSSADITSIDEDARVSPSPTDKSIDARAATELHPTSIKTVFITITKEPTKPASTKPASTKPKATQSTWSKGKHCPYPYPGERCSPPKSEHKGTTASSTSTKTALPEKPCPYPGQTC